MRIWQPKSRGYGSSPNARSSNPPRPLLAGRSVVEPSFLDTTWQVEQASEPSQGTLDVDMVANGRFSSTEKAQAAPPLSLRDPSCQMNAIFAIQNNLVTLPDPGFSNSLTDKPDSRLADAAAIAAFGKGPC